MVRNINLYLSILKIRIMGGEGAMMAMINSIKNNKSLLSKRKEKHTMSGSYANLKIAKFPEATPEELLRIKEKIQKENKQIRTKQIIAFSILFCVLLILIFNIL
jgi:hypothetical protein